MALCRGLIGSTFCILIDFILNLIPMAELVMLVLLVKPRPDFRGTLYCWALFFDVLLTVHLSIILVINQLDAQNLLL